MRSNWNSSWLSQKGRLFPHWIIRSCDTAALELGGNRAAILRSVSWLKRGDITTHLCKGRPARAWDNHRSRFQPTLETREQNSASLANNHVQVDDKSRSRKPGSSPRKSTTVHRWCPCKDFEAAALFCMGILSLARRTMRRTFEKVLRFYYSAPFSGIRITCALFTSDIKSTRYTRGAGSSAG
jgi:hypothetical protein